METQLAPLPISASGIRHKDPRAVVTLRAGLLKWRLSVFLGHQKKRRHYIFLEKLTKYYFSTTEEIIWGHTGVLLLYHLRLGLVLTSSYFVFWNCWELNQDFAYARQVLLYWHTATMYHLLFYYYYCSKRESWSPREQLNSLCRPGSAQACHFPAPAFPEAGIPCRQAPLGLVDWSYFYVELHIGMDSITLDFESLKVLIYHSA